MSQNSDQPIAWINGRFEPIAETKLHVFDMGIVHGASVTEMLRTFHHRPFQIEEHLDRLFAGIDAVGFDIFVTKSELWAILRTVVEHNAGLVPGSQDLGMIVFATAGPNLTYVGTAGNREPASVCVHTFPLPFELWAEKMTTGQKLVIPGVRAIPPECIDPRIKHRSRLHWILADREARTIDPEASALVLDLEGRITETASGNFFVVIDEEIVTPPAERCLAGISQKVVKELAGKLEIAYHERDLVADDLKRASEAFTSSTPYCLMPVRSINREAIGDSCPGPIYQKLTEAWNDLVGLDIIGQASVGREPHE